MIRGIIVLDWCYMCKRYRELVDHLLLQCPIASKLQSLVFELHWVMPLTIFELFESWQGKFGRHRNQFFWILVPYCLMWCIWRERKARYFEGCERFLLEIKSFFFHTLLVWSVALLPFFLFYLFIYFFLLPFWLYLIILILVLDFSPQYIPNVLGLASFFLIKYFLLPIKN